MEKKWRARRKKRVARRFRLLKKMESRPADLNASIEICGFYCCLRQPRSAMKWATKALEINPIHAPAINKMGWAYLGMKKNKLAIKWFRSAIDHNPYEPQLWIDLSNALCLNRDHRGRILMLKQAVKFFPRDADVLLELGQAYESNAKYEFAYYTKYGRLYNARLLKKSLPWFQSAVECAPRDAEKWHRLGYMLNNLSRYEDALICFRKSVRLEPRSARRRFWLASALNSLGKKKAAVLQYLKSIAIYGHDECPRICLGGLYVEMGDFTSARKQYRALRFINRFAADCLKEMISEAESVGTKGK